MIVSSFRCTSVVVFGLYGLRTQTSVSLVCDPKRSRPDGACEVCRVGRCSYMSSPVCLRWEYSEWHSLSAVLWRYSRITSTKSLSFCMTIFSASLTNLTDLLLQSRDCSCYVSRRILAPPPLWLQKHTDLCAHDFAQSPDLWHQPRLANVTCAWSWRSCGITPAVLREVSATSVQASAS
jgi:hypothetical protein